MSITDDNFYRLPFILLLLYKEYINNFTFNITINKLKCKQYLRL